MYGIGIWWVVGAYLHQTRQMYGWEDGLVYFGILFGWMLLRFIEPLWDED